MFTGASAEEVERQVAIPLEVALAGMPHLQSLRSNSACGACELHACFSIGTDFFAARQEVINRLQFVQALPPGVVPQLGPRPGGETLRYLVIGPRDALGRPVYTAHDLRTLQEWRLEREFRRLPNVADVGSNGGVVKRYEIQPDADRFRRYGITLQQLADVVAQSNVNLGGDFLVHGQVALSFRSVGLFGGGADLISAEVLTAANPQKAASLLRAAEKRRLREIRALVIARVNDRPVTIGDVVEGGPLGPDEVEGRRGVVIDSQPRREWVASSGPGAEQEADAVHGVVFMRQDDDPRFLRGVKARIQELNTTAGTLLPGVRIEPYYADNDGGTGALWVHGLFPLNASLEATAERSRKVVELLREFPEVERVVSQAGTSEGDEPQSSNQLQLFVGLKAGPRGRTKLLEELNRVLSAQVPGVAWMITTNSPEQLELVFPGAPAENLLKIVGPDLDELERLAGPVQAALRDVPGVESVAAYRSLGRAHLEFRIDAEKCRKWGVSAADVNAAVQTALGGKTLSRMIEGEKMFDITVRWPKRLRDTETAILDIPIDVVNNPVDPAVPIKAIPRIRLRDAVSPVGKNGEPDPDGAFLRSGAAAIYRENGKRVLPVRFSVRGRSLADVQAEAAKKIAPLLNTPCRLEWSD